MSRSRKKTLDELESLREENRELRATNKSLSRQIKKLEKEYKPEHDQDTLVKEDIEQKKPKSNRCTKCERGVIKSTNLGPRTIITCTICEHREILKNAP